MSYLFDTEDVPVKTTGWVREQVQQNRGGWIYGPIGSGKSHAVRAAGLGGVRVDVFRGPLLGQRFASDLARQIGSDGRRLLEAARREGLVAALAVAEEAVNGHPFVVDAAQHLLVEPGNLDEPAGALWQEDMNALRSWLEDRLDRSPTFLISEWNPGEGTCRFRHGAPTRRPIKLQETSDGFRNWERLGRRAQNNPGALTLARALVVLSRAEAFHALLAEADEDDVDVATFLLRLGRAFQSSAPRSWQRALALVASLGEVPCDAVEPVLGGRGDVEAGAQEPISGETASVLHKLRQLELVKERAGRLSVLPVLREFGIRSLTEQERTELLPAVGHQLLARVNNVRSLDPEHADRVLLAHSIFVALGDMGNAERTAALHVHGLVDLARRISLNERFSDACQQYYSVLRMLSSSEIGTADRAGQRLRSYVQHYHAWNGSRAGILEDAACLDEYERAVEAWPENALWHQRLIQTLVRLGRLVDARHAIEHGYEHVEEHPRRDELLRVRPAWTALEVRALQFSLELIDPIVDVPEDEFPEVADGRDALLRGWRHGRLVEELTFPRGGAGPEGRVVFLQPTDVRVHRLVSDGGLASAWRAEVPSLWMEERAERPGEALEALARQLGEEARRLISTITPDLSDQDIHRKGVLLSYVDALNSDIGLHHDPDRWIVGRIEGRQLIPTMRRLPPVEVPPELMPESTEGLYFARVPVHRDGVPRGPAEAIKPAGSGFGFGELVEMLARMNEDAA